MHPAQNLALLRGENQGPAQDHVVKKDEAGTLFFFKLIKFIGVLYVHLLQDTSAQESLAN